MESHPNIALIIDGYNLLYAMGILDDGRHPRAFELARERLLRKIARALRPAQRAETAIIFDAKTGRRGGDSVQVIHQMQVFFAVDYDEADTMIEEFIRKSSTPKKLTIVSSDHRLQSAARRRKAAYIDSDTWLYDVVDTETSESDFTSTAIEIPTETKPTPDANDVKAWVEEFGDIEMGDFVSDGNESNQGKIDKDIEQNSVQDWVDLFTDSDDREDE